MLITHLDYYKFLLHNYYNYHDFDDQLDLYKIQDEYLKMKEFLSPMFADVSNVLHQIQQDNQTIIFEGAQGSLLDIDYGSYPFVTSSNCTAGAAIVGSGISSTSINYVLGIIKAYTTRVGMGPFPTELLNLDTNTHNEIGTLLATRGLEFGSVTKRPRRCGWFDAVAVKRAIQINGITSLCITKLDVMDTLDEIKICIAYEHIETGQKIDIFPYGANDIEKYKPIYHTIKGWMSDTYGITNYDELPNNAKQYVLLLEELLNTKISIISTGPDRIHTIILDKLLSA